MDQVALVKEMLEDGQRLIGDLPRLGLEVSAAVLLKTTDEEKWEFYVISPNVDTEGLREAYARLHPLSRVVPKPFGIDPWKIRLIGPSDPLGRDVVAFLSTLPGPVPTYPFRYRGIWLGEMSIEEAFVIPLPAHAP